MARPQPTRLRDHSLIIAVFFVSALIAFGAFYFFKDNNLLVGALIKLVAELRRKALFISGWGSDLRFARKRENLLYRAFQRIIMKGDDQVSSLSSLFKQASFRTGRSLQWMSQITRPYVSHFSVFGMKLNELRKVVPYNELLLTAMATAMIMGGLRSGLKRYRTATEIPLSLFQKQRKLRGLAVLVNDSDNLRLYHEPLLRRILLFWNRSRISRQGIVMNSSKLFR